MAEFKGGPVRWKYHRATGLPLPVDVPETSAEFIAAYQAAEALVGQKPRQTRRAAPGSLAAVWQGLARSEAWLGLSDSYRRALRPQADALMQKAGHFPFRGILEKHVLADLSTVEAHKAWSRVHRMPPGPDRWKERSRTFPGIAEALADQWGGYAMEAAA